MAPIYMQALFFNKPADPAAPGCSWTGFSPSPSTFSDRERMGRTRVMGAEDQPGDLAALRDAAGAAEFDLTLEFKQVAQKVGAGDSFTTAQQNAAAQLLEISAAVRELASDARAVQDGDDVGQTRVARAQQLVARTAELREAFGQQPVSQADLADRPGASART